MARHKAHKEILSTSNSTFEFGEKKLSFLKDQNVLRMKLIFLSFLFTLSLNTVDADLFVVFLQGSKILTSLRELSLFHTLSNIPVDEGTLGVHKIKLMIQTSPGLGDGGGVGQHAHGTLDLGEVTTRNNGGWLVVDADLEASWAPVDELDGTLGEKAYVLCRKINVEFNVKCRVT